MGKTDLSKLNLGKVTVASPNNGWKWTGRNHILFGREILKTDEIGAVVKIGPYQVKILENMGSNFLCLRVDGPQ